MGDVLAYFLTWTTHGSWLHGDARGSVDKQHNSRGTPYLASDPDRASQAHELMRSGAVILTDRAREIVQSTIEAHALHRRWALHAFNVRTNHAHVVATCPNVAPEHAMSQFKAWSSRRLREAGEFDKSAKIWTEHGSTRWLDSNPSLIAAIDYVNNHQ